jgi:hypothetical protein
MRVYPETRIKIPKLTGKNKEILLIILRFCHAIWNKVFSK